MARRAVLQIDSAGLPYSDYAGALGRWWGVHMDTVAFDLPHRNMVGTHRKSVVARRSMLACMQVQEVTVALTAVPLVQ